MSMEIQLKCLLHIKLNQKIYVYAYQAIYMVDVYQQI